MNTSYNILIAEDNPIIREYIKEILDELGYHTSVVDDSKSCIEHIKKELPHILILDIMMDGVSGIEILRKIKNGKRTNKIYVIVNSIITKDSREGRTISSLTDAYIEKPAKIEVLISAVQSAVDYIKSR